MTRMAPLLALFLLLPALVSSGCTRRSPEPARSRIDVHVGLHPHSYDRMLRTMDDSGLSRVINLDGGPAGEVLATLVELGELSRSRVLSLASVDWRDVDAADFGARAARDLSRAIDLGARGLMVDRALGLGVSTRNGRLLDIDDPRLDPLWARAAELGVPVFWHAAGAAPYFRPVDRSNPRFEELRQAPQLSMADARFPARAELLRRRDAVLSRHPHTTFVCTGLASSADDLGALAQLLDANANVHVDTAGVLAELDAQSPDLVRGFLSRYRERVLFGSGLELGEAGALLGSAAAPSDDPEAPREFYRSHWRVFEEASAGLPSPIPMHGRAELQGLGLPAEVLADIYANNARRLLGLATPVP